MSQTVAMTVVKSADAKTPGLRDAIDVFARDISTIADILPGMMFALQEATKMANSELHEFETTKCSVTEDGPKRTVNIPLKDLKTWDRLWRAHEHFSRAQSLLPRSMLVSLVSQYDAFLGRLLRAIMIKKPEILNGSARHLTFTDLTTFSSLETARESILEKEIEDVLRSSHCDQFDWMERTFKLPLRKDLRAWPVFIELTERRNLMVHTDGIVSSQYMKVCKDNKCMLDSETHEGARLHVPSKYFKSAVAGVYEIGTKLGQVLWRKLFPDESPAADKQLLDQTYDLIDTGRYALAIPILDCAHKYFDFASEVNELMVTVNLAQAHKWSGDHRQCADLMKEIDWSAKGDHFRLANAVLLEDWIQAAGLVKRIGKNGLVTQDHYRDWPLFKELRKQESFLAAYEEVFGEAFPQTSQVSTGEAASDEIDAVEAPAAANADLAVSKALA